MAEGQDPNEALASLQSGMKYRFESQQDVEAVRNVRDQEWKDAYARYVRANRYRPWLTQV